MSTDCIATKVGELFTGFDDLDYLAGGFSPGNLVCLVARPSMGKTSFALNAAAQAAKRNETVLVFSSEMNKERIIQRLISAAAYISARDLSNGYIRPEH